MTIWFWVGFVLFILLMLALDLGLFNRESHVITPSEALAWSAFWVALALLFNVGVFFAYKGHWLGIGLELGHELNGGDAALQFFTGYVIEKSLSLDNLFVFALIFTYFNVPLQYQHRILFWGVLGALILRGAMIAAGTALIHRFDWITYVFGGFLIFTAVKLLIARHDNLKPETNPLYRLANKLFPATPEFHGQKFFVRLNGRLTITPLFSVLVIVEGSDVLFAVDSIPAIFAVTRDPFLVFTSNVFAVLGLRSLYFALAALLPRFRYLKMSLVFLLAYVGVKMCLSHHYPIPIPVSLAIISGILSVGVLASILGAHRDTAALISPIAEELKDLAELTLKTAKRVTLLIVGTTIILIGIALLILPGPGLLTIILGMVVLGTEYLWARRWLHRIHREAKDVKEFISKHIKEDK